MKTRMLNTLLFTPGWMLYTASGLSVLFGFSLRVAMELRDGHLTGRTVFVQALTTGCTAFLAFLVKRDYHVNISIELLLFLTSFFAVFVVSTLDKAFKFGFKNYLRMLAKRYLADSDEPSKDKL